MREQEISDLVGFIDEDPIIRDAVRAAEAFAFPIFLVGGWIRDRLIGTASRDYDFVLQGDVRMFAERLSGKWGASFFVMGHGDPPNCRIVGRDYTVDMAPQVPEGLEQELSRRDFTINTMAFSFRDQKFLDLLGGGRDLSNRIVRMVSPSVFNADPIRMLRAARLTTVLKGFRLSLSTASEIRMRPERIFESAHERVREEMDRIMASGRASKGLRLMQDLGLLRVVLPEFLPLFGLDQGPYHHLDAFEHTLNTVRETESLLDLTAGGPKDNPFQFCFKLNPEDRMVLFYAALLHDIGKAQSLTLNSQGVPHFYGHEKIGAGMAMEVMKRLCFSGGRADRVSRLIRFHVLGLGLIHSGATDKALRRIIHKLGSDLPLHVLLSLSDRRAARGKGFREMEQKTISIGEALLNTYTEGGERLLRPEKLVSGREIMEILSLPPGPAVGKVIDQVRMLQIDRVIRSREEALSFLQSLRKDGY